ncbi:uncharacterized protein LOC117885882 [Trachemys scripta elegans]|uniref:uncharacterized protein LOC117885882 n=1 Tax=Trachemys scripta elegans TaxID=31138 RepID=UPI00155366F2|nr:uncharacterized protein LOC117885882 [Trachemys scripta elegans]XP_034643302.1 uncharacterized protein LOC117885882 [Trachemys scripta elegans]
MAQSDRSTVDWTPANGSLVPHKDAPGTDVFYNQGGFFIIRSDLGCYLWTEDLKSGTGIKIQRLHPACQGGDHYLSDNKNPPNIYIIKGDSYRVVKDLSTDAEAEVRELDSSCHGGDHYTYCGSWFYIISQKKGSLDYVCDLSTPISGGRTPLEPECSKGLFYFTIDNLPTLIKLDEKWGAQCYLYKEFFSNHPRFSSIHPNVLNFFPGGLALVKGASTGGWECIKTLHNDSDSSITWSDKVTCKVGYAKQQMSSIEHNWSISAEMSIGAGELTKLITQFQFSFKTEYGGRSIRTDQEDWNEAREEEESIQVTLEPKKNLYIWQYRLGIGHKPILFCRDVQFTKENNPPDRIPLPPVP